MNRVQLSRLSSAAVAVAMLTLGMLGPIVRTVNAAPGTDVCPESNDSYESSCYLGKTADVYGFLQAQDDVDMYRVEPLEFGVKLHVALTEQPFPYRLSVFNWQGAVMAETSSDAAPSLDVQLGPPGSYYVVVSQLFVGQISDTAPYRLASELRYPGAVPNVAYSATFRPDGKEANDFDLTSSESADYEIANGRMTIKLKVGADDDGPSFAGFWLPTAELGNFTLALDARVVNDADAGYDIMFRSPEDSGDETGYHLMVSPRDRKMALYWDSEDSDDFHFLVNWKDCTACNPNGANRIVVRAMGNDIRVNINGTEVIHVKDSTFSQGAISFEAVGWGEKPPSVSFSNVLVTTP